MATTGDIEIESNAGKPRRLLFVFEKFPPFTVSGSWRPFFFVRHLPEFGCIPDVISSEPTAEDVVDSTLIDQLDPRCRLIRRRLWVATFRQWFSRKPTGTTKQVEGDESRDRTRANDDEAPRRSKDDTLLFRIYWWIVWRLYWYLDWAGPVVLSGIVAAMRTRYDAVWVSGPHSRNFFAGYWLARILRKPLVLDIRDPWTYGSLWAPRSRSVEKAEQKWARRILRRAARIVLTSPLTMAEMRKRFPDVPADRWCTITNGFSEDAIEPLRDAPTDVCVFRYVGSLNERRTPDVLLDGLKRALDANPEMATSARLQFIGGLAGHAAKIESFGLSGVVDDLGRVSHRDSLRLIHGADVNVLLQTILDGQDVVSGKAFEYLAARKPILAVVSESGGDAWLVRDTGAGVVASFDDAQCVANAFEQCWREWKSGGGATPISEAQSAKYSRRHLARELAQVFDDVIERRK